MYCNLVSVNHIPNHMLFSCLAITPLQIPFPTIYYPIDIIAGTIIITITMPSIINSGASSFVPASSPIVLARFLRASNASSISAVRIALRFFMPERRFCSKRLLSFRYCCTPHLRPNSRNATDSAIPFASSKEVWRISS